MKFSGCAVLYEIKAQLVYTTKLQFCLGFSMSKALDEEEPEVIVKRKLGGFICMLEPSNTDWIKQFPRSAKLMQKSGWFNFCEKLQGYHSQVTMLFIENYRDERVQL